MPITIQKISRAQSMIRSAPGTVAYITINSWDDFGFKTLFYLTVEDAQGQFYKIGDVKIAFEDQQTNILTQVAIPDVIPGLGDQFFSLGQDSEYYKNMSALPATIRNDVLSALRDVIHDPRAMALAVDQTVFKCLISVFSTGEPRMPAR